MTTAMRPMEWLVPEREEASRDHVPYSETARADRGLLRTGCGIAARSGPITRRVYQPRHNLREQVSLGHRSLRRDGAVQDTMSPYAGFQARFFVT